MERRTDKVYHSGKELCELQLSAAAFHYKKFLEIMCHDCIPPEMEETPERVVKAMYEMAVRPKSFTASTFSFCGERSMQIIKGNEFSSVCAHHCLPFFGTVDIAYIPVYRIIGLSKVPRIVEHCAVRFGVQEELCRIIAVNIADSAFTGSVAVRMTAVHTCMKCRGIRSNAETQTSYLTGAFKDDPSTREEYMMMLQ